MPDFSSFVARDGSVDYCGAVEQSALIHSLYVAPASKMMLQVKWYDETAFLRAKVEDFPNWSVDLGLPPKMLCWRGTGQHWCIIAGVYNRFQLIQALTGAFIQGEFAQCGTAGNRYMLQMADAMLALLEAGGVFDVPTTLNIAGHSLGGASGYYLGIKAKAAHPTTKVNVLTFASPKTTTAPCATSTPLDFIANVQVLYDFVTFLPPPVITLFFPWQHNGQVNVIRSDGTLARDDANEELNIDPPWDSTKMIPHYARTYYDCLKKRYDDELICLNTRAVLAALGYIPSLPEKVQSPDVVVPVLPEPDVPFAWETERPKLIGGG